MIHHINKAAKRFLQICTCGIHRVIYFDTLKISEKNRRCIAIPKCEKCGSIEFLLLGLGTKPHDLLVGQIFAEVALK